MGDRGLVLISGQNTAGKSAIHSAITWCLFGKTAKGLSTDDVVNWDAGENCHVEVWLDDGRDIKVRRWRLDDDRGNDVEMEINGTPFLGRQTDVQESINTALRTNYTLFVNTILFSQGNIKYLAEESDRNQRALFKKFLNLSEYDEAAEHADSILKTTKEEMDATKDEITKITERREILHEMLSRNMEESRDYQENKGAKIRLLESDVAGLQKPEPPEQTQISEEEYEELSKAIAVKTDDKMAASATEAKCNERIHSWNEDLSNIQSLKGRCPLCRQDISTDTMERHVHELEHSIRHESAVLEGARRRISEIDGELQDYTRKQAAISDVLRRNDQLVQEYAVASQGYISRKDNLESRIAELKGTDNPYLGNARSLKKQLAELPNTSILEKKYEALHEKLIYTEFIKELFKPKGIQSYIIEQSFDFLNKRVNEYVSSLTSDITMEFEPLRKLKGGGFKEEITIKYYKKGRDITYEHLTDAERVCTNIAIIFALHDFANYKGVSCFDFMFLDEVLDISLDEVRVENLTHLLHAVSKYTPSVFVISHREELKSSFTDIWEVSIENGESSVST
jgi:DNA repair exonuclease SbcCD ATPase subunit